MSVKPTKITDELVDYLIANFSAEDEFLAELRRQACELNIPEICISPEQGRFMQFLLMSIGARRVLEIGTLAGYSAIMMARALPDGSKLTTVERNPVYAEFAKNKIIEAGLDDIIEVVVGDGMDYIKSLPKRGEMFDFVFVDANKTENYKYLLKTTPFIRKRGIFAADNAFAFGFILKAKPERDEAEVRSVVKFNAAFKEHPDYLVTLVPVGDGLILGVKL